MSDTSDGIGCLATIIVISACIGIPYFTSKTEERNEKQDIVAVWKHEANHYSVTVKEGNTLMDKAFYGNFSTIIITDVPKDKSMWYEAHFKESSFSGGGYDSLKIHIHSIDDINGGGWNHGKFGSGTTERVQ